MIDRERIFEETFRGYAHKVRGYLYNQLNNREDAEEVFQDIFAVFWESLKTFRGNAKPSTLLFSITWRRKVNFMRKKYTRLFARSDKEYIDHFGKKLEFRINAILHPMWAKHLDEDQQDLVLAIKRTRENQLKEKL